MTLYCKRRDVQRFDVPLASLEDTLRAVAKEAKDKPAAVDVLVDDKVLMPTTENRELVPPPCSTIVLVQNCSHDMFALPNLAWRFE